MVQVRLACQAVLVGNEVWVLGGWDPGHKRDGGEILDDIWALSLETNTWRPVTPLVHTPSCRIFIPFPRVR